MLCVYISPQHGAFWVYGWRRRPPDMDGNWEYTE